MSCPPSLSIVLATYNGERFIDQQLASLAAQTLLPCELIIGDDGSTDRTLKRLEEFRATAPFPVRINVNSRRLGYSENFLRTATLAKGELIAFCDQDDVWFPTKLQRCVEAFTHHDIIMTIHNTVVVDQELQPRGDLKPNFSRHSIRNRQGGNLRFELPGFAMVISRKLIREFGWRERPPYPMQPHRPTMAHDQWLLFLAYSSGAVARLAEPLAYYRQHDRNTCGALLSQSKPEVTLARQSNWTAYTQYAEVGAYYRDILTTLSATASPKWQAALSASASDYDRHSKIYSDRARLYDPQGGFSGRLAAYVSLLKQKAYRPLFLGRKAWLKDTCALSLSR